MTEPETDSVIKSYSKSEGTRVISEDTSKLVRYALESVVANGSGKNAYIENYRIGGKTGTAQKVSNGSYMVGNYIVSFMGFMPADNPEIVVYVAIDNPKGITQYGGVVAAPIAKNIFQAAINLYGYEKTSDGMPKEYTWLDTKYVILPDVVGMSLDEAKKALKGFKITTSGSGDKVIYESPDAGYYVEEGSTISLMLST
jgi:stage V sporulation protein D (sporulation-specific penicillin-binding protein)